MNTLQQGGRRKLQARVCLMQDLSTESRCNASITSTEGCTLPVWTQSCDLALLATQKSALFRGLWQPLDTCTERCAGRARLTGPSEQCSRCSWQVVAVRRSSLSAMCSSSTFYLWPFHFEICELSYYDLKRSTLCWQLCTVRAMG